MICDYKQQKGYYVYDIIFVCLKIERKMVKKKNRILKNDKKNMYQSKIKRKKMEIEIFVYVLWSFVVKSIIVRC